MATPKKTAPKKIAPKNAIAQSDALEFIKPRFKEILAALGEDTNREGLLDTPKRFGKSVQFF